MHLSMTFHGPLQLNQSDLRWLPQPASLGKHKNAHNLVDFTGLVLKLGALVAESHSQQTVKGTFDDIA